MARQVDNLTAARRDVCLTVDELARSVGVHVSTVVDWSKGRTRPQVRFLKPLAKSLKKTVAEVNAMFGT
jgi:DNA-binding XRE family transcriptional regulator